MRNNTKKIALLVVAFSLICSFATGCSSCQTQSNSETEYERQEDNLTVETSTYNKKVGETDFVVPMGYTATEGVNLVFTSSNPDVVSVNQYGEFTANKEGTATITVSYGEAQAQATVNVGWGGENPRIRMNQTIETTGELKLAGTMPFDLGLWVYYNAKKWNDATYEYTLSDPSVGSIVDGSFIPAKNGTTSVSVKATWRDKTCSSMETSFTVTVADDVELSINGGFGGTIELYTREMVGNATFATSSPFVITANKNVNGVSNALPVNVEIANGGESIVEYDEVNKIIRAKGVAGETLVNVSCEVDGETYTATAKVIVAVSVGNYQSSEKIEFSAMDGLFFMNGEVLTASQIFGESSVTLVSAIAADNELTVDNQNAVLGLKTPNKETLETTITVESASVGYRIPVTAYKKIIDEAKDLDVFCLDATNYGASNEPRVVEGYYVLACDIDASEYAMKTQGYIHPSTEANVQNGGFKGIFDGRGYTISDVTFGYDLQLPAETRGDWNKNSYSMFGVVGAGATIKNFALTGIKFDITNTGGGGKLNASYCAPIATWILSSATVENVYVSINGLTGEELNVTTATANTYLNGFATQIRLGAILRNIIVEDTYEGDDVVDMMGAPYKTGFAYRRHVNDKTAENSWSNVIVISKSKCTRNYNGSAYDAINTTLDPNEYHIHMPNIYRYETIQDFIAANDVDYTKFGDVWDKSGSVPVWSSANLEKYLSIKLDGKLGDKFEIDSERIQEVTVGVSANGNDLNAVKSLTVEGDCVTLTGDKLTINYPGQAIITAVVEYANKEYTLTATVSVVADVETYAKTVEFSVMHGTLPLAEIFGNANTEIVLAYQGETKLTVQDNKITGIVLTEKDKAEAIELTVYSQNKGYKVNCNAYAGIISKAEDLEIFNLNMTDYATMSTYDNNSAVLTRNLTPTITGYYVLAGNIDASEYAMNTQGVIFKTYNTSMVDYGFRGTFDGRGYTISGLTLGKDMALDATYRSTNNGWFNNTYSLFGIIGKGGTVKNVALTGVEFDLTNTGGGGTISKAVCSPIATWIVSGATVENVYVSLKGTNYFSNGNTYMAGFACGVDVGATLNNIVVDDTYVVTDGDGLVDASAMQKRGSFVYRKMAQQATTETSWTNVVVISTRALAGAETNKYDASNITELATGYVNMPNTYRYKSVGDWEVAQTDTSVTTKPNVDGFGSTYWHVVNGVPVWGKAEN